jgi:Uma2 family endonuclease
VDTRSWRKVGGWHDGGAGAERAFVPDVVYASYQRLPPGDARANRLLPAAPDLAIEIVSPDHYGALLAAKIRFYLGNGVRMVWVVDPDDEAIYVFAPEADDVVMRPGDTLAGGDVLPGFNAPVAEIFAQLQS